ncbi:MAG TPA: hypothetical protein PKE39_04415 [Ignavibacteria bacterium]|nr:hypothetical protein [Ignavibacteria bacterium]HMQ98246.1 hypothetical protein [Ignavibacteria bacterium]
MRKKFTNTTTGRFSPIRVNRLGLNSEIPIGKYRGCRVLRMICSPGGMPRRETMEVLLTHLKNGSYELTKPAMEFFKEKTSELIKLEKSGKLHTFNKLQTKFKDE